MQKTPNLTKFTSCLGFLFVFIPFCILLTYKFLQKFRANIIEYREWKAYDKAYGERTSQQVMRWERNAIETYDSSETMDRVMEREARTRSLTEEVNAPPINNFRRRVLDGLIRVEANRSINRYYDSILGTSTRGEPREIRIATQREGDGNEMARQGPNYAKPMAFNNSNNSEEKKLQKEKERV